MQTGTLLGLSALIFGILFPSESLAIDCYECTDCQTKDGKFERDKANVVPCNGSCQKIIKDGTVMERGCSGYGDTDACKTVDATKTTTCNCNKNLCNLATHLEMSLTLLSAVIAMAVYKLLL